MLIGKRLVWTVVLVGLGWALGYAERSEPDFMIAIDAPAGETRVECLSGCNLKGSRDLENPNAAKLTVYSYGCSGGAVQRCGTRVAGWSVPSKPGQGSRSN